MEIVEKLREMLLPVLGFDSIDEIQAEHSLVSDLDADSIDFVEIIYLIEKNFGVVLKTNEIIVGGIRSEELFIDERLSEKGAALIKESLGSDSDYYREGMTKFELFSSITVGHLARVIELKMDEKA